jgi:DNA-directed RNA polymerase specialized sigma24 family protein
MTYRTAYSVTGSSEDAEDVVQETCGWLPGFRPV